MRKYLGVLLAVFGCGPSSSMPDAGGADAAPEASGVNGCLAGQISGGAGHVCATMHDETVVCWGTNMAPTRVPGLSKVDKVAAGGAFDCARLLDGTVWCWGKNAEGQLGDGTRNAPVPVTGISQLYAVAMSEDDTCAITLMSSMPVACWGANGHGELGDGTTNQSPAPVAVAGAAGGFDISMGSLVQNDYACLTTANAPLCWGANNFGQLGDGTQTERHAPTPMSIAKAGAVRAGGPRTCMLTAVSQFGEGSVACVGAAPLGDGTNNSSSTPVQIPSLSAIAVTTNDDFACALITTGAVVCWGNNGGSDGTQLSPKVVSIPLCK